MKLVYTNADQPKEIQKNPLVSLGGYISSTTIPSGRDNNIFPSPSNFNIENNKKEIRMVALHNTNDTVASGVKMKLIFPSESIFSYNIAVVSAGDCKGEDKYELLGGTGDLPYYSELLGATSDVEIELGSIEPDKSLGIWIQRCIKASKKCKTSALLNSGNCDVWKKKYKELTQDTSDECESEELGDFILQVSFNEDPIEEVVDESESSISISDSNSTSISESNSCSDSEFNLSL